MPAIAGQDDGGWRAVEELLSEVFSSRDRVVVYGVGHVGLPLAAVYPRKELCVSGVDEGKLSATRSGNPT